MAGLHTSLSHPPSLMMFNPTNVLDDAVAIRSLASRVPPLLSLRNTLAIPSTRSWYPFDTLLLSLRHILAIPSTQPLLSLRPTLAIPSTLSLRHTPAIPSTPSLRRTSAVPTTHSCYHFDPTLLSLRYTLLSLRHTHSCHPFDDS